MTIFTIDTDNNITAWRSTEDAEASIAAGAQAFSSPEQLGKLAAAWPAERLITIWNSLPGVSPSKGFKNPKTATRRIWDHIQGLNTAEAPTQKAKPAKSAPAKPSRKSPPKKSSKATKAAKPKDAAPREGSKKAQVITMLERKAGATLSEIMKKMGRQKHTVRGFMAGAMKKAGYRVESFKPEGGERSYRLKR